MNSLINKYPIRKQSGYSIVELLVGVAIGLVVLAGATYLLVNQIVGSKRQYIQVRMDQDLRNASELIALDLRRAAYWGNSILGTTTTSSTATPNPYKTVTLSTSGDTQIAYAYAQGTDDSNLSARTFGFRINSTSGALELNTGSATWYSVTNPDIQTITTFTIVPAETNIDIRSACANTCTGNACPVITVRTFIINITGRSISDSNITRNISSQVMVRNDSMSGTCPP